MRISNWTMPTDKQIDEYLKMYEWALNIKPPVSDSEQEQGGLTFEEAERKYGL